jgi:dephospho-CoA kinase
VVPSRGEKYKARKMKEKTVIGVTGMPGAGKDIAIEVFRELGFPIIVMGDEVRAEARQRGLQPTPENLGKVMLQIRAEEGPEVLARRCIPKIKAADAPVVIIDGIRSMHEVQEYKKRFPHMKVMAVHASPYTRFKRLTKRRRSDDPKDWTTFSERDQRELSVGLSDVVATADLMVINEGTIEDFKNNLRYMLKRKFRV